MRLQNDPKQNEVDLSKAQIPIASKAIMMSYQLYKRKAELAKIIQTRNNQGKDK